MALGSLAANPNSGVKIVPCGMNYFHAHKFRSRAVVEFGLPIDVPKELVEMYRSGERREATRQLLEIIYQGLVAVTVTSPDYDTLMVRCVAKTWEPHTDIENSLFRQPDDSTSQKAKSYRSQ